MSADLRGILEAYSAVYDNDVKETLNSFHDEITDMDLSLISDRELSDIAEEALQELFEEGYSLFESEIILEDVIVEASSYMTAMMKGQNKYRKQQKRQEKIDRVKGAVKGALDTAKMKASSGAVKAYGAYRKAKQVADDKARRTAQTAKNFSAQTSRKASEAKAQVKSGLKGMIRKAAERVASGASKVAKRMTEGKNSSYLETDMKKRQKNNEKARKEMEKMGTPMKNPHFEEVSKIRKDWGDAYRSIYEKKMDPVGQEDGDIDNDGDKDSSDEYLMKRRKAISKAMGKKEKVDESRKPGESPKEYAARMTKKHSGGKSKTYDPMKDPNFDHDKAERTRGSMQELYKGKHGQSDKEYADSRSQGGKMVSGDSKMSGAEYTHGRRVKAANPGMQPDVGGKTKPKSQGKMDKGTRADLEYRKANLKKEDLDIFDIVLEYLQVEGIAESFEDAQWVMVNVLDEEDIDSILDEARRADKEGYARGSKENPKRKDIPHGDVSQRSMLHSKLKRRADEMGRARRSSARNKAGGRTPVGKKEKAFLQAVTRTAGQVHNPNVPDTGKHKK